MLIAVLIISIILILISFWKFRKLFNPFILEVNFIVLMIIIPQVLWVIVDPTAEFYIFSDLAILLYVVCLFLGTFVTLPSAHLAGVKNVNIANGINWLLFFALLAPLVPVFLTFDFSFVGIRAFYEYVVFTKFAAFFELSKMLLYLIIFFRLLYYRKVTLGTLVLIPFLFLYGSKMALLDFFIAFFVFLEHFRSVSYFKIGVAMVAGAMLLIYYRYSQTVYYDDPWSSALGYFDQYKNQSFLIEQLIKGNVDYYYGRIYTSSYLKYIPRIIWEGKPANFGFALLNWDLMPEAAAKGYMPAFGLGSLFADFGYYSIAFGGFAAGVLKRWLYDIFLKSRNNISFLLLVFPVTFITAGILFAHAIMDKLVEHVAGSRLAHRQNSSTTS